MGAGTPGRIPILYLAPWIDIGGTDKNTIDWFRGIDRERFAPYLITTQPSENRRLDEVAEYAEEIWVLPDLMAAEEMPAFILDFIVSRKVQVVHLMNSRLGFDLLPDITGIADAPGIVVQLHVEERDRSGYVRYVTTRYGNLVDRFSVTSEHLAAAVEGYGVPPERIEVVYIGVDAEEEFSPERVEPVEGLNGGSLHVLFPARIVQQKDPLLMVEVAAALRDRDVDFQVHVLGEGDLEGAVRERVAALNLDEQVKIHPPTATPQRWYAACDTVLLTSEFEGVPAVVFEAMAMGLPVVASALPGNSELLGEDYDGLVEPRDSVERYVEELAKLAEDRSYKESHGQELRQRAREHFSLERMAAGHEAIYAEVAAGVTPEPEPEPLPEPLRFRDRPVCTEPLVSVLIPHFNQARFLGECVNSVWAQTYPNVEIVVVDDCSTERDTATVLEELEEQDDVTVLRLERNGGPSRARNRGLEHCSGRYVLPLDADNLLLPEAIEVLVEQLSTAGEDVGFIYPKLQFFGNREDYYEPPPYNVYTLFHGNFCDTCSLIDRQVFDAGLRYREEIFLGHEDWEFVLRLAAHGVRGEAAHVPTLRYRKWGFNRSDAVDHAHTAFDEELRQISPFAGREEEVKAAESPALTIALLRQPAGGRSGREALARRLGEQSCIDVELIAPFPEPDEEPPSLYGPRVRRLPTVDGDPAEVLRGARQTMRGRYLLASEDPEATFLDDRGFVEKLLRRFTARSHSSEVIAFADTSTGADAEGDFSFRGISATELAPETRAHAVAWATAAEGHLPHGLQVDRECPAHSLARLLSGNGAETEWRHAASTAPPAAGAPGWTAAGGLGPDALTNILVETLLPGSGRYTVPRWEEAPTWIPPLSTILVRYREPMRDHWLITNGQPPFGYGIERHLGALRSTALEGTERLVRIGEEFDTVPRGEWEPPPAGGQDLGYLEMFGLPQLKVLALGIYRPTGQQVLVTLPDDPLLAHVDVVRMLGSIEPIPIEPEFEPPAQPGLGLRGLVKSVDLQHRRHRYAIGEVPPGQLVGELGAMAESELQGSIATWIVDGQLVTERHSPPVGGRRPLRAARWILEPAVWTGIAGRKARVKSALRRSAIAAGSFARPQQAAPGPDGSPAGWLFPEFRPSLSPLYASYHPVTEDQLLTKSEADAAQLGYDRTTLLGFIRHAAPVTGTTQQAIFPIPWARRFGAVPRED